MGSVHWRFDMFCSVEARCQTRGCVVKVSEPNVWLILGENCTSWWRIFIVYVLLDQSKDPRDAFGSVRVGLQQGFLMKPLPGVEQETSRCVQHFLSCFLRGHELCSDVARVHPVRVWRCCSGQNYFILIYCFHCDLEAEKL